MRPKRQPPSLAAYASLRAHSAHGLHPSPLGLTSRRTRPNLGPRVSELDASNLTSLKRASDRPISTVIIPGKPKTTASSPYTPTRRTLSPQPDLLSGTKIDKDEKKAWPENADLQSNGPSAMGTPLVVGSVTNYYNDGIVFQIGGPSAHQVRQVPSPGNYIHDQSQSQYQYQQQREQKDVISGNLERKETPAWLGRRAQECSPLLRYTSVGKFIIRFHLYSDQKMPVGKHFETTFISTLNQS
ncbi:unnamed protein product [Protopolystoma xenopodis]|uniref:Uncharacterized protein n=1 Tax=Protopolystoma xenopodis TaxID=117903 RepID=A0A448X9Q9_9PLAT|nr:unnamed protein product [Protopolystoma xenopodis]